MNRLGRYALFLLRITPLTIYQMGVIGALFTEEPQFIVFLVGLTASDLLNLIMKEIIREPRPSGKCLVDGIATGCGIIPEYGRVSKSYGMPSGHAQCLGYTAAFWSVLLLKSRKPRAISLCVLLVVIALVVAWSRVKTECHSVLQVSVGLLTGGALGGTGAIGMPFLARILGKDSSGD
jgi:membrane-associated phospholipid phosphatase